METAFKNNTTLGVLPIELGKVNAPDETNLYGTEEIEDFVDLIYSAMEAYEKAMRDAKLGLNDLILLGNVFVNLAASVNGANIALAQALDLSDGEITELVNQSAKFELGESTPRYRQIVKELLYKFQTYNVFRN